MNGFSNKEMLRRVLDKLENIEDKLSDTNVLARSTNGKVKMHTKLIYALSGAGFTITLALIGWLIKIT